jgi:AhpD family alkylhydroperoxidase
MPFHRHDQEVIAVAISVAVGCRPCTTYHLKEARGAGAEDQTIQDAVTAAVCVRASATDGMRRHALGLEPQAEECGCAAAEKLIELASLGASLAVNCTANIAKHLAAARQAGAGDEEVSAVLDLVRKIRTVGIGHAERLVTAVAMPESPCAKMGAGCC